MKLPSRNRIVKGGRDGDEYIDRVAKYVPVEVLAGYLALTRLFKPEEGYFISRGSATAVAEDWVWHGAFFLISWLLTPLYVWTVKRTGDDWIRHALVSSVAFPIWAFAMRGPIVAHYEDKWALPAFFGAALLILFSMTAGLIQPKPETTVGTRR